MLDGIWRTCVFDFVDKVQLAKWVTTLLGLAACSIWRSDQPRLPIRLSDDTLDHDIHFSVRPRLFSFDDFWKQFRSKVLMTHTHKSILLIGIQMSLACFNKLSIFCFWMVLANKPFTLATSEELKCRRFETLHDVMGEAGLRFSRKARLLDDPKIRRYFDILYY